MSSFSVFCISFLSLVLHYFLIKLLTGAKKKMADIAKLYGTDSKKEEEGVWRKDFGDDIEIKIARTGNPRYQKYFNAISKPHRRAIRSGSLNEEVAEKLLIQCMAATIVLDWRNIDINGEPLLYSKDNAIKLLTEYKDLRNHINDIAQEMEAFRAEDDEEAVENLKK